MSGNDDAEEHHRYRPPHTERHQIPTISKYREEKQARQSAAQQQGSHGDHEQAGDVERPTTADPPHEANGDGHGGQSNNEQRSHDQQNGDQSTRDTSQADASATDPRARRKDLKNRKDERAEREVTDPVTHLPVRIHDLTSASLKEVPENDEPFGSTTRTATGISNKRKSGDQLQEETKELQQGHDAMRTLFPPPKYDTIQQELADITKRGVTIGLVGTSVLLLVAFGLERLVSFDAVAAAANKKLNAPLWTVQLVLWLVLTSCVLGGVGGLVWGVRDWMERRIGSLWDDAIWDANGKKTAEPADGHETETVAWLNALLRSVWPLINPDLFTSLADTLEDVMQASLPKMVQMVSVNDIGQGSESIRILGIRWLPTGAASRSVGEDGTLHGSSDDVSNDRKVSGKGEVQDGGGDQQSGQDGQIEQGEDGAQQQVAEGLEAEEGDFINMEVSFAYRARAGKRSIKDRAKDMHLYMAFYLPANVKFPVWVDLRGVVGTMRLRLQLCPDPPFFSLCTLTFLGQPKVELSCTPLSKHAMNIMDVPLISNFVQSSVDAAMAQYVAPKSLNLDLKDMLAGDDFKKDTTARGVLVVNIKRGYDFKIGDKGIPLLKDGSSDPYVSVGWAKFGKPMWSTRLLLKEMEPWWDETAYVLVTPGELNVDERIRLQLWDSDKMTADDDLGRVEVDLKEVMKRDESNGKMWHRSDGFRALEKGDDMPGKLDWSIGYYSKARIQNCQLAKQTFDAEIRSIDQLEKKADEICSRKLREAQIKEGRHKGDADELDQQKQQEMKRMQDAMIISSTPPEGYPSGIFSIQIHQITGLELERVSKTETDKAKEGNDEEEEGEGLPSAYCTVIINHGKAFKTRTKPKNAKPFYNASTERYLGDWRSAEVYVSVRDARVKEDDPLLGIVHLPLGEIFKERSQVNGFYPISGGVGYGRIRLSMVWRSVQLQAPAAAIGWELGTLEVKPSVSEVDVPQELRDYKLKFHTDLGSGKMYPDKNDGIWKAKNDQSLKLAVHKRYSSCLAIEFRHTSTFRDKTPAFGVLWLKDIADEDECEVSIDVWKGDYERATKNALPEPGEKVGTMKVRLVFWNGLGAAHSKWAAKSQDVSDVVEVLEAARDNLEEMQHEKEAGVVDGGATDSSSNDDDSEGDGGSHTNGDNGDEKSKNPIRRVKDLKKHNDKLSRHNRGLMQWKVSES